MKYLWEQCIIQVHLTARLPFHVEWVEVVWSSVGLRGFAAEQGREDVVWSVTETRLAHVRNKYEYLLVETVMRGETGDKSILRTPELRRRKWY